MHRAGRARFPVANTPALPDEYSFYYLAANVHAAHGMADMELLVGSDCRYKLYLNGQSVGDYTDTPRFARWDMDRYRVTLNDGWNLLLVKTGA